MLPTEVVRLTTLSTLDCAVFFPKPMAASKPFPVVIFSGGGLVPPGAYYYLARYWAKHGYLCLAPQHSESKKLDFPKYWGLRPREISSLIDDLGLLEKKIPRLKNKIDRERIGVGGHSFGATAAFALAGAPIDVKGTKNSRRLFLGEKRISAIVALSPNGTGMLGKTAAFRKDAWGQIDKPMLLVSGTEDYELRHDRPPSWRKDAFLNCPPGDKFHLLLSKANHYTYMDTLVIDPDPMSEEPLQFPDLILQKKICEVSLAFWDAYLKTDPRRLANLVGRREENSILRKR